MAKVLLVEDDSNLREIYGARLEAEGYEVVTAGDGEEGLAAAVKERPHLVIADVMMPKISGFDMLDILRTTPETKNVKVIVMTALSQDEDRKRGESLGADRYFVKSQVVLEDLVETVRELLSDVPGAALAEPAQSTPALAPSEPADSPRPEPAVATPAAPQELVADPAPTASLDSQVADFVATSPLMNGMPPSQDPVPTDPSPAPEPVDQPVANTPVAEPSANPVPSPDPVVLDPALTPPPVSDDQAQNDEETPSQTTPPALG